MKITRNFLSWLMCERKEKNALFSYEENTTPLQGVHSSVSHLSCVHVAGD